MCIASNPRIARQVAVQAIEAYVEQNGLLVLEAESGTATASESHAWQTQTAQAGYAGSGYRRALPDIGARYEETETTSSPRLSWPIYYETAGVYSVWVRGMAPDAGGDSLHVGLDGQMPSTAADLTGFTSAWSWRRVTPDGNASLDLTETGGHTLDAWMREDGLRVDRLLLVTDTNYIPTGLGPAESPSQAISETVPGGLGTVSIAYQYDALYRLAGASYSGALTATYAYVYDSVGNMTAFTETVGVETTRASRTFDAANRLQTMLDLDAGTTSYYYDDNGNLVEILPPGATGQNPVGGLRYDYDPRNLLITHTTYVSGTGWVLQAAYVYDGGSDRLQQVDGNFVANTGASPVTTTYTNDIFGLTQVLVADDGTAQVANLFGLDLILQDSGSEVRTLLADGLGSVRTEMVGGVLETATTYEPYGQVLVQTGASGTVYGFTGEQEDSATGLLYLRARYYNPALKVFQSRDPWEGTGWRPGTLNYYIYGLSNPLKYVDPSGHCGRDWGLGSEVRTEQCMHLVRMMEAAYGIIVYWPDRDDLPPSVPNDISCFCIEDWDCESYASIPVERNTEYRKWRLDEVLPIALSALLYEGELGRNATRAFLQGVLFVRADGPPFDSAAAHHFPGGLPGFGANSGDMKLGGPAIVVYNSARWGDWPSWLGRVRSDFTWIVGHEMAHQMDWFLMSETGLSTTRVDFQTNVWNGADDNPGTGPTDYARTTGLEEDLADTIMTYVWTRQAPNWTAPNRLGMDVNVLGTGRTDRELTAERRTFVEGIFEILRSSFP